MADKLNNFGLIVNGKKQYDRGNTSQNTDRIYMPKVNK